MEFKTIKTEIQYQQYLDWIDEQFNNKISPDSTNGKIIERVLCLIKKYEDEKYPLSSFEQVIYEQTSNS